MLPQKSRSEKQVTPFHPKVKSGQTHRRCCFTHFECYALMCPFSIGGAKPKLPKLPPPRPAPCPPASVPPGGHCPLVMLLGTPSETSALSCWQLPCAQTVRLRLDFITENTHYCSCCAQNSLTKKHIQKQAAECKSTPREHTQMSL